jgi:hypothetical protein
MTNEQHSHVHKNCFIKEAAILGTILIGNGYPLTFMKPAVNKKKQNSTNLETVKGNIIEPYLWGLSEKILRIRKQKFIK